TVRWSSAALIVAPPRCGLSAAPLEELHGALVFFRGLAGVEGAEVPPLPGDAVDLARIQPVLPGFQLANHGTQPSCGASSGGVGRFAKMLSDKSGFDRTRGIVGVLRPATAQASHCGHSAGVRC